MAMNILVACEESQRVTTEFRRMGHNAFSCDIIDQSGGHPEWHIMQDVLPLLNGDCVFETTDGTEHEVVGKWDMIIAFPPCTYLTNAGNRWFNGERYGDKARKRIKDREQAIKFFLAFANADCEKSLLKILSALCLAFGKNQHRLFSRISLVNQPRKNVLMVKRRK